ncbi:hypothetical protein ACXPWS_28450 [Mycobacterium sp. BMJ-28]
MYAPGEGCFAPRPVPYRQREVTFMIPFICPDCGRIDIDTPDCLSCAQPAA